MRNFIFATVAMSGLFAATTLSVCAAPSASFIEHRAPGNAPVANANHDRHGHEWRRYEWHHRHWEHGHWHNWD
jgi:hypothetical protein